MDKKIESAVGPMKGIMIFQFLLSFAISLGICISAGVILWNVEENNECRASNNSDGTGDSIDVAKRFKQIISIYFAIGITDSVRTLAVLIAIFAKKPKIAKIH